MDVAAALEKSTNHGPHIEHPSNMLSNLPLTVSSIFGTVHQYVENTGVQKCISSEP
jgi:hypothetical protein